VQFLFRSVVLRLCFLSEFVVSISGDDWLECLDSDMRCSALLVTLNRKRACAHSLTHVGADLCSTLGRRAGDLCLGLGVPPVLGVRTGEVAPPWCFK